MKANDLKNPRVAFQGEPGAFSDEAARKLLGHEVELIPCETFEKMFAEVEDGSSDYCLAPIDPVGHDTSAIIARSGMPFVRTQISSAR